MRRTGFFRSVSGNIAISFALALLPMMLAIGAAVDLARQNNANTTLQAATDAAVLAGAAARATNSAQLQKVVEDYVKSNDGYGIMQTVSGLEIQSDSAAGIVSVRLTGKIATSFMALAGFPTLNVGAYAEVHSGGQGAEIALVLDNTASMASEGRLVALKAAAHNLVNKVMSSKPANAYVKIGIVPFADYVNVGVGNRGAKWMSVPADSTTVVKNVCSVSYPHAVSSNCRTLQGIWNNDGVPTPYSYQVCDWNYGAPVTTCADQTVQHRWYGCVGSRTSPHDEGIGSPGLAYPGIMDTNCTQPLTALTDVPATLNAAIDNMNAVGETYIAGGVLWGWNILDAGAPFTEAKTTAQMNAMHGVKSMVIMTDGENTKSPVYPYHWGTDTANANRITSTLCSNAKAAGITVYTVGFKVQAQASKDLLINCASSPAQAFDAADDTALQASFDTIANQLAALRLSQ